MINLITIFLVSLVLLKERNLQIWFQLQVQSSQGRRFCTCGIKQRWIPSAAGWNSFQSKFLFSWGSCWFILWNLSCFMQGEKECSYYMKTGHCKFGATCKFHHPELGFLSEAPTMYPPAQPSPISSPHPYPHLANWQMGRPPVVSGSFLPGSYPPMMLPPTLMPMQGWNPYIVSFYYLSFLFFIYSHKAALYIS